MVTESRTAPSPRVRLEEKMRDARTRVPGADAAWDVWGRDRRLAGSLLAGAIAYRLFVWLLPVALLLSAGLGFLGAASETAPDDTAEDLGMSRYIASTVSDAASQAEKGRWVMLAIGLVALYTGGLAGVKALRSVHQLAWDEPPSKQGRPPLAVATFLGLFLVAAAVTGLAREVREQSDGLGLAVTLALFVAYAGLWLLASVLLPHADAPWTALVPGAALAAIGIQLLHVFTVYYLAAKLDSSSELYGALGAAASVLLWLYLLGRVIVGAAVLNAVLWRRQSTNPITTPPE